MNTIRRLVVIHTAFLGDIILTLPMVQVLKRAMPETAISFVAVPAACAVLQNHPEIESVIEYDKKGRSRGLTGVIRCAGELKKRRFDIAVVPHRSMRSALLPLLAGIPLRVGFSNSAGKFLFTETVRYESGKHEILRNIDLIGPLGVESTFEAPVLYPSQSDRGVVDDILANRFGDHAHQPLVGVAPGSVWKTKRWPEEYFRQLTDLLIQAGNTIALIGGREDGPLCDRLAGGRREILNAAGRLTILQSADLVRRCNVLVTNDSAPMHVGVAMNTPVLAIFGATVPEFGFAPVGERNRIHQTGGLECRPCSIHGGDECPIGTFDCMLRISPEMVLKSVLEMLPMPSKGGRSSS